MSHEGGHRRNGAASFVCLAAYHGERCRCATEARGSACACDADSVSRPGTMCLVCLDDMFAVLDDGSVVRSFTAEQERSGLALDRLALAREQQMSVLALDRLALSRAREEEVHRIEADVPTVPGTEIVPETPETLLECDRCKEKIPEDYCWKFFGYTICGDCGYGLRFTGTKEDFEKHVLRRS